MKFLSLLLLLSVMVGCSTTDSPRSPSTGELQRQREAATDTAVYEEGLRKSYEATVVTQKSELERLRAENETLKRSAVTNELMCQQWLQYLHINDYLLENHAEVLKRFNQEYAAKRDALFAAAGEKGRILEFEVDDVFLYKGYVIASSLVLWENQDGSGTLGRCAVYLDPDKEFAAMGCEMTGKMGLSRQELTTLRQGGSTERVAAQVSAQPSPQAKPLVSEATQQKLISAGIGVVSAWLIHAIQSSR